VGIFGAVGFYLIPREFIILGPYLPLGGFPCLTWSILLTLGGSSVCVSFSPGHYLFTITLACIFSGFSFPLGVPTCEFFSYSPPPRNAIPGIPVDCTCTKAGPVNWITDHVKFLLQIFQDRPLIVLLFYLKFFFKKTPQDKITVASARYWLNCRFCFRFSGFVAGRFSYSVI
jgi:hypothetical protein